MAKGKGKPEPTPGQFRVTNVCECDRGNVGTAPTKVLKYLQRRCHSREELMDELLHYAIKNKYLGIEEYYEIDLHLWVSFIENNIEYDLLLKFHPYWSISRDYPNGKVESYDTGCYGSGSDDILTWTGPDAATAGDADTAGGEPHEDE